jgi:hypothetical protein
MPGIAINGGNPKSETQEAAEGQGFFAADYRFSWSEIRMLVRQFARKHDTLDAGLVQFTKTARKIVDSARMGR